MDRIDHRVAIVTGGTRGIGAAITTTLARAGYHVAAGYSANQAAAQQFIGKLISAAPMAKPLATRDHPHDLDGLARHRERSVEPDSVPAFHYLRTAGADAEPEPATRQ